jgi:hypothetical protein
MGRVQFEVVRVIDAPVRAVWDALIDWPSHGAWIPATTIETAGGDPAAVGYTFTGWTGAWPLALEDRMRVTRCDWDDAATTGICEVEKLGPVLGGGAGFSVSPSPSGTVLIWREDVTVPYLPRVLAPVVALGGRIGFGLALRSFASYLRSGSPR